MTGRITTMLALLLLAVPAAAQDGDGPDLAISAFADLLAPLHKDEAGEQFRVNQAEVDLEGVIAPRATAAMAVAYDPEAATFALAVLSAEYALADGDDFGAALMAGQFDVRFGVDWRVYASIDRRLVTAPLTTRGTHEGWNDQGVNLHLRKGAFAADAYLLNGSGAGRGNTGNPDPRPIEQAYGGRLGALLGVFEAGVSAAAFRDEADEHVMDLTGADLQATFGPLALTAEYLRQVTDCGTPYSTVNKGAYAQGIVDLDRVYGFARWDAIDCGSSGSDCTRRISLGGGYVVETGLEIRLEHEIGLRAMPNRTWLQMAVSFGSIGG
ncbi:MAG TPA: hypothetical protein PLQ13_03735 [Candidatus Krumholzibacteria bacterium]|nr:hypothetical protein [Candidatus Krumholzibacteria bacterium]